MRFNPGDSKYYCEFGEFAHSGKSGDCVYALAALKEWARLNGRKAKLYLIENHAGVTGHYSKAERDSALPLIQHQPYIELSEAVDFKVSSTLDGFRDWHHAYGTLEAMHSATIGLCVSHKFLLTPWLEVTPNRQASCVFARSGRYHSNDTEFPWRLLSECFDSCVFVGTESEYKEFSKRVVKKVPWYQCKNLLEVAEVIAGGDFFAGNQSCPLAIATGLRIPRIVEGCIHLDNCFWGQKEAFQWRAGCPISYLIQDGLLEELIANGDTVREIKPAEQPKIITPFSINYYE